jgi:YidC/Oxa1 family membrane protein insertase
MICLIVTLFGVNQYFNKQEMERLRKWRAHHEAVAARQEQARQTELEGRLAPLSELPLVEYMEGEDRAIAAWWDGQLLRIGRSENPQDITVLEAGQEEVTYTLRSTPAIEGAPLIYSADAQLRLESVDLQAYQTTDVQLVYMDVESGTVKQGLGIYERGTFRLISKEPTQNAVALIETAAGYLPVGFYNSQEQRLIKLSDTPSIVAFLDLQEVAVEVSSLNSEDESFYVLENGVQQLVFSSKGGALAEINLPFVDDTHPDSVVRSIEFDDTILEEYPANARFPLHGYYTAADQEGAEPIFHEAGDLGGYYPLLRRHLIQRDGSHFPIDSRFYALNVVSDYPEVAQLQYTVTEFTGTKIVFEASQSHRRIQKTFELLQDSADLPYVLHCKIKIDGDSRGLWLSSGIPEVEWISNAPAPALKYRITRQDSEEVELIDLPKERVSTNALNPDWLVNSNGFFGVIIDPLSKMGAGYQAEKVSGAAVPSRLLQIDQEFGRFQAKNLPGYQSMLPLPSQSGITELRVFAGPLSDGTLRQVDGALAAQNDGEDPDYRSSQSFHGYFAFISRPFSKFLFVLMQAFYGATGSWALSIVLLTVALRAMLYPLNAWSMKKMRAAQVIKPLLDEIDKKHKKDPQKAQLEKFQLMRQHKVNPAAGCFGLFIQMPFLIGMFDLLKSTFELRGAPFIPGWIDNLTAPDTLLKWDFSLPVIGNELHVLPIITGLMMYLQTKVTTKLPKDKAEWTDAHRQQAMMGPMMAVMFAFFFYNFPSGLNLYWLSSTGLGALQQWYMNRSMPSLPLEAPKNGGDGQGKKGRKAKLRGLA